MMSWPLARFSTTARYSGAFRYPPFVAMSIAQSTSDVPEA